MFGNTDVITMATIKSYTDKPKRKPYFKHNVVYCKKGDIVITYPNVLAAEAATGIYSDRIINVVMAKMGLREVLLGLILHLKIIQMMEEFGKM